MRNETIAFGSLALVLGLLACDAREADHAARRGQVQSGVIEGEEGPPIGRRWVLRDADGAPVNAVVEPTCRADGPACAINDVGTVGGITPECGRVIWLDDQYVDLKYNLITGRAEDCAPTSPTPEDFYVEYADAKCAGPFYTYPDSGIESAHRFTRRSRFIEEDGILYAQSNERLTQDEWYGGPDCEAFPGKDSFAPWFPVPPWALNALSNPPYSMHWE